MGTTMLLMTAVMMIATRGEAQAVRPVPPVTPPIKPLRISTPTLTTPTLTTPQLTLPMPIINGPPLPVTNPPMVRVPVLVSDDDDYNRALRLLYQLEGDAGRRNFINSVAGLADRMLVAHRLIIDIIARDAECAVAHLLIERAEEKAIAVVSARLMADVERERQRVAGWSSGVPYEQGMAVVRQHEAWVNRTTTDARQEAQARTSQSDASSSSQRSPDASCTLSNSSTASAQRFEWREPESMRQIKHVDVHGWTNQ